MKTLQELKQQPGLCITGRLADLDPRADKWEIYRGFVQWDGFEGSVLFGFNECGLMEHVSVSHRNRRKLPTWNDMAKLKDMFFRPDEMVVQVHPAEANYVHGVGRGANKLENVLHLWRPMNGDFSILNRPEEWQ